MAITGAVIAVIGLGVSIDSAKASKRASDRQSANQASADATERAIKRRKAIRQQRIKSAQIEQSAINTSVSSSSGEIAGVSGTASNFAASESALSSNAATSLRSLNNARDMSKAGVKAAYGSALQSIGTSVASANLKGTPSTPSGGDVAGAEAAVADMFTDTDLF